MNIGARIKQRRLDLGLTQEGVGNRVGVSKGTVAKWESGNIENMRRDKVALLAKALHVSPLWIMGIEDGVLRYRTKKVPLLGAIAAGEPILLAEQQCEYYVETAADAPVDFCLKVKGDSMVDARICDGDIAFIRQQPIVENGEIAAVVIDDEVTLKRFYRNNGGVILKPENSKYQPRYYTEKDFKDVRILGRAVVFQSQF